MGRFFAISIFVACFCANFAQGQEAPAPEPAPAHWVPPPPIAQPVMAAPPVGAPSPIALAPALPRERSRWRTYIVSSLTLPRSDSYAMRLAARGYNSTKGVIGVDLGADYRLTDMLWIGGRTGTRYRSFGSLYGDNATASGQDILATIALRSTLVGGVIEYWGEFGLGPGFAWSQYRDAFTFTFAPRMTMDIGVSLMIFDNWYLVGRASWDWYPLLHINDLGDKSALGGFGFGLGLQWRT